MTYQLFPSRYSLLKAFIGLFLLLSLFARLSFLVWNFSEVDLGLFQVMGVFLYGLVFDIATISFFTIPFILYLILMPQRFYGSLPIEFLYILASQFQYSLSSSHFLANLLFGTNSIAVSILLLSIT